MSFEQHEERRITSIEAGLKTVSESVIEAVTLFKASTEFSKEQRTEDREVIKGMASNIEGMAKNMAAVLGMEKDIIEMENKWKAQQHSIDNIKQALGYNEIFKAQQEEQNVKIGKLETKVEGFDKIIDTTTGKVEGAKGAFSLVWLIGGALFGAFAFAAGFFL